MAHPDPFLDEMVRQQAALDRLIAARTQGQPSQRKHDEHVDQAEAIAASLRQAARGPGRSVNPPIARLGTGYVW